MTIRHQTRRETNTNTTIKRQPNLARKPNAFIGKVGSAGSQMLYVPRQQCLHEPSRSQCIVSNVTAALTRTYTYIIRINTHTYQYTHVSIHIMHVNTRNTHRYMQHSLIYKPMCTCTGIMRRSTDTPAKAGAGPSTTAMSAVTAASSHGALTKKTQNGPASSKRRTSLLTRLTICDGCG